MGFSNRAGHDHPASLRVPHLCTLQALPSPRHQPIFGAAALIWRANPIPSPRGGKQRSCLVLSRLTKADRRQARSAERNACSQKWQSRRCSCNAHAAVRAYSEPEKRRPRQNEKARRIGAGLLRTRLRPIATCTPVSRATAQSTETSAGGSANVGSAGISKRCFSRSSASRMSAAPSYTKPSNWPGRVGTAARSGAWVVSCRTTGA